jgi:hypothetical protein
VSAEEVDAAASGIRPGSDDYRAHIEIVERDTRFAPGVGRYLLVKVENCGGATWPWGSPQSQAIHVSYHWSSLNGASVVFDGERSVLPCAVRPGGSVLVAPHVNPPRDPGRYFLEVDLVHEGVRWFECACRVEVVVAERWDRL